METQISPDEEDDLPELDVPNQIESERQNSSQVGLILKEIFQTLILAIVMYFMIDFVVARVRVENISMKPTLLPGEFLLVNKMAYKFSGMQRGDIVVFHNPQKITEDFIKRLIGLPGDTVEIKDGVVIVNQVPLIEPYIMELPNYQGRWQVPAGSIFVLGDNRNSSSDSHAWGFVPLDNIMGKAIAVYWPLQKAQVLSHPDIVFASDLGN
jgi:signal peptidase I